MTKLPTRAAGIAGIIFILLVAVPGFSTGAPPDPSSPASTFFTYYHDHRTALIATGLLGAMANFFVVFFLGGLYNYLRRQGGDVALIVASAVGIVITGVVAAAGGLFQAAAAFRVDTAQHVDAETVRALNDAASFAFTFLGFSLAAFMFATGTLFIGARHVPNWLGQAGRVLAVLEFIGGFAVFGTSGAFALGSPLGLIFGLAPLALFMLATSVVMVTRGQAMDAGPG